MTQLMGRPVLDLPGELSTRSALADLLTGARAALVGLAVVAAPVFGLWVLAPYADDTAGGATRLVCSLWLLGHGAPLARGGTAAPLTVTPLLLTAFTAVLLHRTGARIGRRGRRYWRAPLAVCAGYLAVAACAVAECGSQGLLRSRPLPDLLAVAALVIGSVGSGLYSATGPRGHGRTWPTWLPGWARPVAGGPVVRRAAGAGALGLVAAGGVVFVVAVALGSGAAGRSAALSGGGAAGYAGMLLACLLLLPNAVLWASAYALGPGFAVGTGTVVAPTGTRLGELPRFPLLALVPGPGGPGWQLAVCGLPLLAGLVPAVLLGRQAAGERAGAVGAAGAAGTQDDDGEDRNAGEDGEARPWHPAATVLAALGSSLLAGTGALLCAWTAGGALAGGRMSELGPVPWQAGLATAGWLAAVTVPGALLTRWRLARQAAATPTWWQRCVALTNRWTARTRLTLHGWLSWAAQLPSPSDRTRTRTRTWLRPWRRTRD